MVPRIFKSKAEVIAFVNALGIEEAILLGNLWLEVKNKVTALEQSEIISVKELEKEKAVLEREKDILIAKNKEIKALEDSTVLKDALILDKENEIKRCLVEIRKKEEDKENERNLSKEGFTKKEDEIKQLKVSLQKNEEALSAMRLNFNSEKQELKLDRDRSVEDMRINNAKLNEENERKIIELQR